MKRVFYYAAALAAMVGCAQPDLEDVAVAGATSGSGDSYSVTVAIDDATRVAVSDAWITSWEEDDELVAVGAEASSVLEMSTFDEETSTFSGDLDESIVDFLLFYPSTLASTTGSVEVSYAVVALGCQQPAMVSSAVLNADGSADDLSMKHIGAAMDVQVTFTALPAAATSYMLTGLKLVGVNNAATIAYNAESVDAISYTAGDITVSGVSQEVVANTDYSFKFSIMPFDLADGDEVAVEFVLLGDDGNTYIQSETITANAATSFARATNNWLKIESDMSAVEATYVVFEGKTISLPTSDSYVSANEAVATVNASGVVTGVATGRTTVMAGINCYNIEVLNTAAVGDYYYKDGTTISYDEYIADYNVNYNSDSEIVGVLIEASAVTGAGKLVSLLCPTTYKWSTDTATLVGDGITDGVEFMAAVQALDSTFETYPAFGFVDGFNQDYYGEDSYEYVAGADYLWYMPTNAELGALSMTYYQNVDNWNTWFTYVGGTTWPSHGTTDTGGTHYWNITGQTAANAKYTRLALAGAYVSYASEKTESNRVRAMMTVSNIVVPEPDTSVIIPTLGDGGEI